MQRLSSKTFRFNELHRTIPDISRKMLTQELRSLEDNGFITRKVYASKSPMVEYQNTKNGKSLLSLIKELEKWSISNIKYVNELVDKHNASLSASV